MQFRNILCLKEYDNFTWNLGNNDFNEYVFTGQESAKVLAIVHHFHDRAQVEKLAGKLEAVDHRYNVKRYDQRHIKRANCKIIEQRG